MLSKTIECLSMPMLVHKEGGFLLFHLLFGIVYGLFRAVPLFTRGDVKEYFNLI